jgi:hypothetical protein
MAYAHTNKKGKTYYLHTSRATLKGGYTRDIYYFGLTVNPEKALDAIPAGMMVIENDRTGLPFLKKAA